MSTIAPATPADFPLLLRLVEEMHRNDPPLPMGPPEEAALRALLDDPSRGTVLVARGPGALLGYLILGFGYSIEFHGVDAFVDELYVAAAHQGKGLGTRLLEAAEESAKVAGIRALHLEVDHANPDAARLYERVGYKVHPRHLMTKWLRDGPAT